MPKAHTGTWSYHDDDCLCGSYTDAYCNRDSSCWSCCGACKQDSECSGGQTHPTFWKHPKHGATIAGYRNAWPIYKSNEEIRAVAPECFDDD